MRDNDDLYYLNMIDNKFRSSIYQILYIGVTAYNSLLEDNKDIIKSYFFGNIKTRLLTFMIYRQFEGDMLGEDIPFKVDIKKVNNFGYNALNLKDNKVKVSLAKTLKQGNLPNKSVYRKKDSVNNFKYERQLKFNFDEEKYPIQDAQAYFIVGFGVKSEKLTHLNLLMPNSSMDSCICNVDLLKEYYNWVIGPKDEEYIERKIVNLKSEGTKVIRNEG